MCTCKGFEKDILRAADALKNANTQEYMLYRNFTDTHGDETKNVSKEVGKNAVNAVKMAKEHVEDVEFSPEDAGRSDFDFVKL